MPRPIAAPAALAALLVAAPAPAQDIVDSQAARFAVETVTEGVDLPWGMTFLPDGRMLVTEREGALRLVDPATGAVSDPLAGVPEARARGQGGMLDVEIDPAFADNGLVYLSYAADVGGGLTTQIARGRLGAGGAALEDVEILLTTEARGGGGRHFGSRLAFGPDDGMLYITVGDRGDANRAQDLGSHAGKVLRIAPDGTVPADNPFVGRDGALGEIYTYGNRNAQGLAVTPWGALWAHEHGPRGGDEVNDLVAGTNYGWPVITHGRAYSGLPIGEGAEKDGMAQPLHYWDPSIAPSGMDFYRGGAFPGWQGDLFIGALALTHLNRLDIEDGRIVGEERLLDDFGWRVRDVETGPDGFLYLLIDDSPGRIVRLRPA